MQNDDRIEVRSSGLTRETTAVAGSTAVTAVGVAITRMVLPLVGEVDSMTADRSRTTGKIKVSSAHQV